MKIMKTLWGVPHTPKLISGLPKVYNGFEVATAFADFDRTQFLRELRENYLSLITQVHTCGYPIKTTKVDDHVESFKKLVDSSINDWQTDLINVHSGVDSWTLEQSIEFF